MIVYRYEHPSDRLGPYRWHHAKKTPALGRMTDAHSDPDDWDHPGPLADLDHYPPQTHAYGFATKADADRWFLGWETALAFGGFRLVTYDVPDDHVIRGTYQVAFDPARAEYLGPYQPTHTDRKAA